MANIFITGSNGFLGKALVRHCLARQHRVVAFVRNERSAHTMKEIFGDALTLVVGDLTQPQTYLVALKECDCVIHAAAHFKLWGKEKTFRQNNVLPTQILLKAAKEANVSKFVYISAAAVVQGEPQPMRGVNETYPLQAMTWAPYSKSKAEAEALVIAANESGAFETVSIRPPMIWGKGMPTLEHMIAMIHSGQFKWAGDGSQRISTAHIINVCEAALQAVAKGKGGEAYFIADAEEHSFRDFITALVRSAGVEPPKTTIPMKAAWVLAGMMEAVWKTGLLRGEPPITRQLLRLIASDFTIDTTKARQTLGYMPIITWHEGITAMKES